MRYLRHCLTTIAILSSTIFAHADDCAEIQGTYLTAKVDKTGVEKGAEGRTVLTFAAGGTATMTDSAQGGIAGYQAFGMMQGEWDCVSGDGVGQKIQATLVDFSYPDATNPDATIARVDVSAVIDRSSGALVGKTIVNFFPLLDDPFSGQEPASTVEYDFEGQRIRITPPSD
ncbi:MAG: hypothetical protein AAGC96_04580 [Pseudomonadota bacterium]